MILLELCLTDDFEQARSKLDQSKLLALINYEESGAPDHFLFTQNANRLAILFWPDQAPFLSSTFLESVNVLAIRMRARFAKLLLNSEFRSD